MLTVQYRPGYPCVVGDIGVAGVDVVGVAPWGTVTARSGDKPEHGPGGFELPIYAPGMYQLRFLSVSETFEHRAGHTTILSWLPDPVDPLPASFPPRPPEGMDPAYRLAVEVPGMPEVIDVLCTTWEVARRFWGMVPAGWRLRHWQTFGAYYDE